VSRFPPKSENGVDSLRPFSTTNSSEDIAEGPVRPERLRAWLDLSIDRAAKLGLDQYFEISSNRSQRKDVIHCSPTTASTMSMDRFKFQKTFVSLGVENECRVTIMLLQDSRGRVVDEIMNSLKREHLLVKPNSGESINKGRETKLFKISSCCLRHGVAKLKL
jgi:hypothetical protein